MPRLKTASVPTDFFDDAAQSAETDTAVFFPTSEAHADEAKAICATCPVREECLEYALETRPGDGVWGGLTSIEAPPADPPPPKGRKKSRP